MKRHIIAKGSITLISYRSTSTNYIRISVYAKENMEWTSNNTEPWKAKQCLVIQCVAYLFE